MTSIKDADHRIGYMNGTFQGWTSLPFFCFIWSFRYYRHSTDAAWDDDPLKELHRHGKAAVLEGRTTDAAVATVRAAAGDTFAGDVGEEASSSSTTA